MKKGKKKWAMGWENKNAKSGIGKRKLEKEILETKMGKRN